MKEIIIVESIQQKIFLIRRQRVMLDSDLAQMYGVQTKVLNQTVKRNIKRFPPDFMFQLKAEEYAALRSQFVTLKLGRGRHRLKPEKSNSFERGKVIWGNQGLSRRKL